MGVSLRPYQETWVGGLATSMRKHRRVLGVLPTGGGKTRCFTSIAQRVTDRGKRATITAHRTEIVEQISSALDDLGVKHGLIVPGKTATDDPIQVAMIQTLARRLGQVAEPDLLITDEAHHGVVGSWEKVASAWRRARQLGVTATPERLDGCGLGAAFDDMVVGPSPSWLIENKFLSPFSYLAPPVVADISNVAVRSGGDFNIDQLAAAMDKPAITGDAIGHYRRHLDGKPAIAFCVDTAHAEHVATAFREAGIRAASVDGTMDRDDRKGRIKAIGDGRLQVLTSCNLISEGTDIPVVAGAILLRHTWSLSMFLQQCGRVLRLKPDGSHAVILDHVGSVHRHGMPDEDREWSLTAKRKRDKAPSVTTCESCFQAFPAGHARTLAANCNEQPCPILAVTPVKPREIVTVDGELEAVDAERIKRLRTARLTDLITGKETRAELEEIRKARGYKAGWTRFMLMERRNRRSAA